MSISISAVSVALLMSAAGKGILEVMNFASNTAKNGVQSSLPNEIHFDNEMAEELLNKEFKTNITNSEVLIKTLKEHGAANIKEDSNHILCDCDKFHFDFHKNEQPFFYMTVTYKEEKGMDEIIQNIDSEYKINAQEVSYNKIKERLEAQNLEIENEEIYDDNTIVLTVNLE